MIFTPPTRGVTHRSEAQDLPNYDIAWIALADDEGTSPTLSWLLASYQEVIRLRRRLKSTLKKVNFVRNETYLAKPAILHF